MASILGGSRLAIADLVAATVVLGVAYPLHLVQELSCDGSILHSVEFVSVAVMGIALIFEAMGINVVSFAVCGTLFGAGLCPFDLQWKRGHFVADASVRSLVALSVGMLLGVGCALVLSEASVRVAREAVLVSMIGGCAFIDIVSVSPGIRSFGLALVLIVGAWALLVATIGSVRSASYDSITALVLCAGLGLSAATEAKICGMYARALGRVRNGFELVARMPRGRAAVQLCGFMVFWSAVLAGCGKTIFHGSRAVIASGAST